MTINKIEKCITHYNRALDDKYNYTLIERILAYFMRKYYIKKWELYYD